jgi:hypothetical protein
MADADAVLGCLAQGTRLKKSPQIDRSAGHEKGIRKKLQKRPKVRDLSMGKAAPMPR